MVTADSSVSFTQTLNLTVNDINEAPTTSEGREFEVAEGGSYTLTTVDLSASDEDAGDGAEQLTWTVTTAPIHGQLQVGGLIINSFTQQQLENGEVIYVHGGAEPAVESFVVQVADDGEPSLTADSQTITVFVTPVGDAPTAVMLNGTTTTLAENADTSGAIKVADIVVTDSDAGPRGLELVGDDAGLFELNRFQGELSLIAGAELDFETNPFLDVTVRVIADPTVMQSLRITVSDENDAPTVSGDERFEVVEGGRYTLTAVDLSASDEDAGDNANNLTWTVTTEPTRGGILEVDGTIGVTLFTQQQLVDGEVVYVHGGNGESATDSFVIQVADDEDATATPQTIAITVTNTNDAPTTDTTGDSAFDVDEGGMYTLSTDDFSAGDVDADDNASNLTWTVITAPTSGQLEVDGAMVSSFTQEQLVDGDVIYVHNGNEPAPDSFVIQVADDEGATATMQTINVTVMQVNDAPELEEAFFTVSSSAIAGTAVGTVMATDVDNTADMLSYSISNTTPFAIDSDTGEITVSGTLGTLAVYAVDVVVSDGGLTDTATIIVQVGGAMFADTAMIVESATANADVDLTFDGLTNPAITDASTSTTGVTVTRMDDDTINVSGDVDFEALGGILPISVMVTADGIAPFIQRLNLTVNDVAPMVDTQSFTVDETAGNNDEVDTVVITGDMNSVTFAITSGNTGNAFEIDADTGLITVADSTQLDTEVTATASYELTVTASDGTATNMAMVTVTVTDVAPMIAAQSFMVNETAGNSDDVGTVVITGDMNSVTFAITGGNGIGTGVFAINANTGAITVADSTQLDTEVTATASYELTVTASDGTATNMAMVTVTVTDVAPMIAAQSFTVNETAVNSDDVGTVVITGDMNSVTFAITGGTGAGVFAIDNDGLITVAGGLDFENTPNYTLTVAATAGTTTSTAEITVNVNDINEAPINSIMGVDRAFNVAEGGMYTLSVGDFSASDVDAGDGAAQLTWTVMTAPTGGQLRVAGTMVSEFTQAELVAGAVVYVRNDNDEVGMVAGADSFVVQVADDEGATAATMQTITVTVTPVDDAPTAVTLSNQTSLTTSADTTSPTTVADIGVTDPDGGPRMLEIVGDDATSFMFNNDITMTALQLVAGATLTAGTSFNVGVQVMDDASTLQNLEITVGNFMFAGGQSIDESASADSNFTLEFPGLTNADIGTVSTSVTGVTVDRVSADTINVSGDVDFETLAGGVLPISVMVTAEGGVSFTQVLNLTVNDINDAPTTLGDGVFSVAEGGMYTLLVDDFSASDEDVDDNASNLTWTVMAGGLTGGQLELTTDAGTAILEFTQAQLATMQVVYVHGSGEVATDRFVIQVQDDGTPPLMATAQTIGVMVTPVNDVPVLLDAFFTVSSSADNDSEVGIVTATDADLPANTLTYNITSGNDDGVFAINTTNGAITIASNTNLGDSGDSHALVIQVSDGDLATTATITVQVGGAMFATVDGISESATTDANVDLTFDGLTNPAITAASTGTAGVTVTMVDDDTINVSGVVDFETLAGGVLPISVTVTADGIAPFIQRLNLTVTDVAPMIDTQSFMINETAGNSDDVGTVVITGDMNSVTFAITGGNGIGTGVFAINANTGAITVADSTQLDTEVTATASYELTVTASDGTATNMAMVTVTVTDIAPMIDTQSFMVNETAGNSDDVGTVVITGDMNSVTFAITGGNGIGTGVFAINANTGAITVADSTQLDTEVTATASYELTVTASDGTATNMAMVTVTVTDVAPMIAAQSFMVNETAVNNNEVDTVVTTGDMNSVTFAITGGNGIGTGVFAINANTGAITVADSTQLDTEVTATASYELTVTASDGTATNMAMVTVTVTDIAPMIDTQSFMVNETAGNGAGVGTVVITGDMNSVTFAITGGNGIGTGVFAINANTGAITVADSTQLDTEVTATASYELTVTASDGTATNMAMVTVTVTDIAPMIDTQSFMVNETAGNSDDVGTVVITGDMNSVTFAITGGNGIGTGVFAINANTGAITVADSTQLDTEVTATASYELTVTASDGTATNMAMVTVTVTDVAPMIAAQSFMVNETAGNSDDVDTVVTTGDMNSVTFAITGGNGIGTGVFAINANTGAITVADSTQLDTEVTATASYELTVTASDGTATNMAMVTVTVTDIAPMIDTQSFMVNETAGNGAGVGTVVITGDMNSVTFAITGGNGIGTGVFAINANTGAITVADSTQLDTEVTANASYELTVTASDGTATNMAMVTVTVTDIAPMIDAQFFMVDETAVNGAGVGTVVITGDMNSVTFAITTGNTGDAFAIDADTGLITVADPSQLDFEAAENYTLTVTASDGTATDMAMVTVTVTDVAPMIDTQSFTVDETAVNGDEVDTVAITGDMNSVTFAITGGTGAGVFAINANTGAITVADSTQLDTEATASYELTVTASDGTATNMAMVTVTVTDVAPMIAAQSFMVNETAVNSDDVGTVVITGDMNSVTFAITTGNTGDAFAIDADTGLITVAGGLDFENTPNYTLTVAASDGTTTNTATITVNVTNIDETPPSIDDAQASIAENAIPGAEVYDVNNADGDDIDADDADGQALQYSITAVDGMPYDADTAIFAIDASTGAITLIRTLDFETAEIHTLTVEASDGTTTDTATITVNVTDIDETPPSIANTTVSIAENAMPGDAVIDINDAITGNDSDADDADGQALQYSITDGNTNSAFAIDQNTGDIITVANPSPLNFENIMSYTLTVEAVEANDATNTDTATIIVNVNNVDEIAPMISGTGTPIDIAEGHLSTVAVFDVNNTDGNDSDEDDADGQDLQYSITAGNTAGNAFAIDVNTGIITVADSSQLDFDATGVVQSYNLVVTANDGTVDGVTNTGTATVNINLLNSVPMIADQTFEIIETAGMGATLDSPVVIIGDSSNIDYSITGGTGATLFGINNNGMITVLGTNSLDFDTGTTSYTLNIMVDDGAGQPDSTDMATITINLVDVDEVPPVINDVTVTTLAENATLGTVVIDINHAGTTNDSDIDDTDDQALQYSITSGNADDAFAIDADTGIITVADPSQLDFETTPSYTLTVEADDGVNQDTADITIDLMDIAPILGNVSVSLTSSVINGDIVTTLLVSESGDTNSVNYAITNGNNGVFSINPESGEITIVNRDPLNFSDADIVLTVTATAGAGTATAAVTIDLVERVELALIAANDNPGGFVIYRGVSDDQIGSSVSGIGDFNKDGFDDVVVSGGGDPAHIYVVFGDVSSSAVNAFDGVRGFAISGAVAESGNLSTVVSGAGDVNGDGFADLIIGNQYADPNNDNSGASYVVFGGSDTTAVALSDIDAGTGGFVINGIGVDARSGRSVSSAGDVNGDGLDDVIVGANLADSNGNNDSGASYVVFGKPDDTTAVELSDIDDDGFVINGASIGDQSGISVSSAGDVNGDGLDDLIVGADGVGDDIGASYVVFGKGNNTSVDLSNIGTGGFVINGASTGDQSGFSVSSAGDVNGDGLDDLIVGADGVGTSSGASYVVFGKSDNTTAVALSNIGSNGFAINGASTGDQSGFSVSSAGDINGDGLDDLIVGANLADPNSNDGSGASYVVFGKSDNTTAVALTDINNGTGGFAINGVTEGDQSGFSVSAAGDVNGDGFDDVIVGAPMYNSTRTNTGGGFVIFGGRGVSTSAMIGNEMANTLTGTNTANQLIGGRGDDTLIGGGGADVLRGGAGDDVLAISDSTFASIDGGTGNDSLRLDGAFNLNLSAIHNNHLESIEIIDLNSTSANTLTLTAGDLLSIVGDEAANQLRIDGNASDTLILTPMQVAFFANGAPASIEGSANMYQEYLLHPSLGTHTSVSLLVQSGIMVQGAISDMHAPSISDAIAPDIDEGVAVGALVYDINSSTGTMTMPDVDGDGVALFYRIESGNIGDAFRINSSTGHITVADSSQLDFEVREDYALVVSASDGENSDTATITIGLNDTDPSIMSVNPSSTSLDEGTVANGTIVSRVVLTDTGDTSSINYAITSGNDNGAFAIDDSGVITVADGNALDFEVASSHTLTVAVNDKTSGAADDTEMVTVTVNNIVATLANQDIALASSIENNGIVLTLAVDDPNSISYRIVSSSVADGIFSINDMGEITVTDTSMLDFNGNNISLVVEVSESGLNNTAMDMATITIDLFDGVNLAHVVSGTNSNGFAINGAAADDRSGISVSGAGDVNGDGFADVIVGADGVGDDSGASYVVFGKGNNTTAVDLSNIGNDGFVINGANANDQSGRSVSTAGDVNGDGLDDLIVGASGVGGGYRGASYVVFGKRDNTTAVDLSDIGDDGFVINGARSSDRSGISVSTAGDVNGDGLDDLIVGANRADSNTGASYVVFGKRDNTTAVELSDVDNGTGGFVINGAGTIDRSGTSVSTAGDVNGDGLDDLIVGTNRLGTTASGVSYVVFGKNDNTTAVALSNIGNNGFVINGVGSGDRSGISVSTAGDVNGDGLDDLIVGADGVGTSSGASYVVFGKSDNTTTVELSNIDNATNTDGFVINGASANDQSGISVSSAGDVNGDGFDDLIVGARYSDLNDTDSGASYVVFGKLDGSAVELGEIDDATNTDGFVITGANANDQSGISVSSAGDVNGDGFDDLIVGASGSDISGIDSGASYVIFGGRGASVMMGSTANADSLSGDGTANQIVGGRGNDTLVGNGGADVLRGGAGDDVLAISDSMFASIDGGLGNDTLRLDGVMTLDLGSIPNNRLESIEIIDLNGAVASTLTLARDDIISIVGSSAANRLVINGTNMDTLNITGTNFFEAAGTEMIDTTDYRVYRPSSATNLDNSVSLWVQIGINVIGAVEPTFDEIALSAIENGSDQGFVINGVALGDRSGYSVSGAGDVNGDGFADVIVGASGVDADNRTSSVGASYVVFGKSDNNTSVDLSNIADNGFVINGANEDDRSGVSVSTAGDINGDGLDDLIVGASGVGANTGASYVVFGKGDNTAVDLSNIAGDGFVINGANAGDFSGRSVSAAGDVNGDGLDDIIVGASSVDTNNGVNSGASYVVFGKADDSAIALASIQTDNNSGGFIINGAAAGDFSGRSVSAAGDVNGDGLDDVIVGAGLAAPRGANSGASYVVFGKTDGEIIELADIATGNDSGGFVINGASILDGSGRAVSGAGDVNGDGFDDVIVGAPGAARGGENNIGISYVVFGKSDGSIVELSSIDSGVGDGFAINGRVGFVLDDEGRLINQGDQSGYSVSGAGDINGDGLDDVIIGAPTADQNGVMNNGVSYVVFGKSDKGKIELSAVDNGIGGFAINGAGDRDDYSGRSVSGAGDINGDGFDDLIVGAHRADPNLRDSGASYVIFGGQGVSTSAIVGNETANTLPGDSMANQIIGGAGDDTLFGMGGADVLRGGAGNDVLAISDENFAVIDGGLGTDTLRLDSPMTLNLADIPNNRLDSIEIIDLNETGSTLALVTDDILNIVGSSARNTLQIDGGSTDTLLIDAPFANTGVENIGGTSYRIYQAADSLGLDDSVRLLVDPDVEVVTSAVELAAIQMSDNDGGFVINGANRFDVSGYSVSGAGDVNGDGFDDLIVGAEYAYSSRYDATGVSYVVFGKTSGDVVELADIADTSNANGFVIEGVNALDFNGRSVSGAGDINGDGLDDLIVGALEADADRMVIIAGQAMWCLGKRVGVSYN